MHDTKKPLDDSFIKRLAEVQKDHESGNCAAAECGYRELIDRQPAIWQLHYNLGMLLFDQHRFEEALECYLDGIAVNDKSVDLLYNVGICLKELNRLGEAGDFYRKAVALAPNDIDCRYNLAGCYRAEGREAEALTTYFDILELNPGHVPSLNNAAYLSHKSGKIDTARELYRRILTSDPDHAAADHMLAALSGVERTTAPESYVRDVFDQFAAQYDNSLESNLHYRLPAQLLEFYRLIAFKQGGVRLLDLGCGTGLVGEQFRAICSFMTGVDLSIQMVEAARNKNIYKSLYVSEIVSFLLKNQQQTYDLMISADVFPYMGDLSPVLTAAREWVMSNAYFLFSVEHDRSDAVRPQLQKSGRFSHSSSYLESTAAAAGWNIRARKFVDLRKERGGWVKGTIYALQKNRL
jgi:predicted TPR repeat methyltransferase